MKVFLKHYKLCNDADVWKVFRTIVVNNNIADLIVLICQFLLFTFGAIGLKYFAEGMFQSTLSLSFSLIMCFKMIKKYNRCRQKAFERYSNIFQHELSFFSKNNEYLQFVLFYEGAIKSKTAKNCDFNSTLEYCNTEIESYSQSPIVTNPWFIIFASFLAASLISLFWESNETFMAIGLFSVVYASLFFVPWILSNSGKHRALTRLRKFCFWAQKLSDEEKRVFLKIR
ncbi:hypothetical protein MSG34_12715 [Vibrio sp. 1CM2L]|uniref:hypothetical protein n=1 Tax=unclassified Vibrio TaxID=2614977 RepID=UPI0020BDDD58|nr:MULTISPECIES: hypothetical protein [unclassified Vibrio]MCK8071429.1 hypothetical protein [Vibrio sp. 1CM23M]MCK8077027.1 hypothetical protein [Vibrio sp. 1CM2L]